MLISAVTTYVKQRTGEQNEVTLLTEINQTWTKLWSALDTPDALLELDVIPQGERVVVLPWFVYQVKAAKRGNGQRANLFSPRPYYQDNSFVQGLFELRLLHRTPLYKTLTKPGQLRFIIKKVQTSPVTINIQGGGEFGVREVEELILAAGEKEISTSAGYHTVTNLAKSTILNSDIEVYDISNELVGVLPSAQYDTWCQHVQITDRNVQVSTQTQAYNYYTFLYKKYADVFTTQTDSIPDDYGLLLQRATVGEMLMKSKDEMDQTRADKYEGRAGQFLTAMRKQEREGKSFPLDIAVSPYYSTFNGNI